MKEILKICFQQAEKDSELHREAGIVLAKTCLLMGDWEGMNAVLAELGMETCKEEDRPWLAPPPVEWEPGEGKIWTRAEESFRSGECGFRVRIEKDGRGLEGVHVLVGEADPPFGRGMNQQGTNGCHGPNGLPVYTGIDGCVTVVIEPGDIQKGGIDKGLAL